jgi:hypothetical protein
MWNNQEGNRALKVCRCCRQENARNPHETAVAPGVEEILKASGDRTGRIQRERGRSDQNAATNIGSIEPRDGAVDVAAESMECRNDTPAAFALKQLTAADEIRIAALLKKAAS